MVDAILAGKIPVAPLLSETPETKDQKLSEHNSSGEGTLHYFIS